MDRCTVSRDGVRSGFQAWEGTGPESPGIPTTVSAGKAETGWGSMYCKMKRNNIRGYAYSTFAPSAHLLVDIWVPYNSLTYCVHKVARHVSMHFLVFSHHSLGSMCRNRIRDHMEICFNYLRILHPHVYVRTALFCVLTNSAPTVLTSSHLFQSFFLLCFW